MVQARVREGSHIVSYRRPIYRNVKGDETINVICLFRYNNCFPAVPGVTGYRSVFFLHLLWKNFGTFTG